MKKLVLAAAVLSAFASAAHAQSSVTLFGVIDTNVTHLTAGDNPVGGRTFIDNSGINSSRLGFRGTEDLGGGLKAGFWLEAGINTNSGAGGTTSLGNGATYAGTATGGGGLTFNRRSTVSLLSDQWGEVRVGRDYGVSFYNDANVDPYGYNGIAEIATLAADPQSAGGATITRVSNSVMYFTPNTLGGFFAMVDVGVGGNPNDYQTATGTDLSSDGNYYGVNLGYQNGPIYAGISTSVTDYAQTKSTLTVPTVASAAAGGGLTYGLGNGITHVTNLGVSYNFGFIKPDFFYQTATVNAAPQQYGTDVASLGLVVPLGQGEFRFSYGHAKGTDYYSGSHANLFGAGYVYNLSKRTALYGIVARVNNTGSYAFSLNGYTPAPAPGEAQSGVQLGIRTSF
jgi:predicted porin